MKKAIAESLRRLAQRLDPKPAFIEMRPMVREEIQRLQSFDPDTLGHPVYYSYGDEKNVLYLWPTPDTDYRIFFRGTW